MNIKEEFIKIVAKEKFGDRHGRCLGLFNKLYQIIDELNIDHDLRYTAIDRIIINIFTNETTAEEAIKKHTEKEYYFCEESARDDYEDLIEAKNGNLILSDEDKKDVNYDLFRRLIKNEAGE